MRLLLVDDDEGLRALLRTTFEAVDVEVEEAADARSAQRQITVSRPDAIVLDVSMPGLNGAAYCAALKNSPTRVTSRSCCSPAPTRRTRRSRARSVRMPSC